MRVDSTVFFFDNMDQVVFVFTRHHMNTTIVVYTVLLNINTVLEMQRLGRHCAQGKNEMTTWKCAKVV